MAKQTMGEIISTLRKEKGMTQKDLAEQMGVTDKAVSKWERNLSCPDISSVPRLAEVLGVSVEQLMDVKPKETSKEEVISQVIDNVLRAMPVAMGVALVVFSVLGEMGGYAGYFCMAGIGIFCLAIRQMKN